MATSACGTVKYNLFKPNAKKRKIKPEFLYGLYPIANEDIELMIKQYNEELKDWLMTTATMINTKRFEIM